jgi:hypothetical protein
MEILWGVVLQLKEWFAKCLLLHVFKDPESKEGGDP